MSLHTVVKFADYIYVILVSGKIVKFNNKEIKVTAHYKRGFCFSMQPLCLYMTRRVQSTFSLKVVTPKKKILWMDEFSITDRTVHYTALAFQVTSHEMSDDENEDPIIVVPLQRVNSTNFFRFQRNPASGEYLVGFKPNSFLVMMHPRHGRYVFCLPLFWHRYLKV